MSTEKSWIQKYNNLASKRFSIFKRSFLMDKYYHGLTTTFDKETVFIFISPSFSSKYKLMTLAHEYGHLLSIENEEYVRLEVMASETVANATAIKILAKYGISEEEYLAFYYEIVSEAVSTNVQHDMYCGAV